ncbi:MAG: hypothetical protein LBR06_04580 [Bacteroidales bacterium]|jgi:hypothetical protein|nr:hypothetical protein [Bacteroidales bacterium]
MKLSVVLAVASVTLMVACTGNSRKQEIIRLVKAWQGKEIVFPDGMVFPRLVSDTVPFDVPKDSWKVLVYLDSSGCTPCKLQLGLWEKFIAELDSISGGTVPLLLFFHPKDNYLDVELLIKQAHFEYPINLDTKDSLNKLNKFPKDERLCVFLLDTNNIVRIIGHPVYNLRIKDLYFKNIKEAKKNASSRTGRHASAWGIPQNSGFARVPHCTTSISNLYAVSIRSSTFILPQQAGIRNFACKGDADCRKIREHDVSRKQKKKLCLSYPKYMAHYPVCHINLNERRKNTEV